MIQKELLNELGKQLIAGSIEKGKNQIIDVFEGQIVVRDPLEKEINELLTEK